MVAPAWRCKQPKTAAPKPMASQAAGNGAASNKQPTPVAATMGENGATLAALEQPAVALPLSEHNSKASVQNEWDLYSIRCTQSPNGFQKANPTPKLQRPPPVRLPSGRQSLRRAPLSPKRRIQV
ncbi:hypothetical protein PtrM4_031260 [Pyrenophora tritici-repentis]|uniref:Uncharacterized protein n=1 Tax=Pyrenophora tritici-repentis TaxID=45151 RepID=A0A316ZUT4_9PLEO|nr:hypothetical protein PtrM4_031260 [Pyrenophora tritici-repentis]